MASLLRDGFKTTVAATGDLLTAAVSLAILAGVALTVTNEALGHPVAESTVGLVVFAVAVGGSYPFVADPRLLDRLTSFAVTFVAAFLGLTVLASIPFFAVGGVPTGSPIVGATRVGVVAAAVAVTAALQWGAGVRA